MTLLIEALDRACPGVVPGEYDDTPYMWMGSFVRHVVRARLDGREDEVRAVFAVIEEAIEPSQPGRKMGEESNLAIVGFLEDLQNGNLLSGGSTPGDFRPYLGSKSLKA
ncbi:MAG: hypothetical protein Q8M47_00930 [Devosia sp.]|nr:hypothetical protein [Devosia sp.]